MFYYKNNRRGHIKCVMLFTWLHFQPLSKIIQTDFDLKCGLVKATSYPEGSFLTLRVSQASSKVRSEGFFSTSFFQASRMSFSRRTWQINKRIRVNLSSHLLSVSSKGTKYHVIMNGGMGRRQGPKMNVNTPKRRQSWQPHPSHTFHLASELSEEAMTYLKRIFPCS